MSTVAVPAASSVDFEIIHKLILSGQTIVDISPGGHQWLDAVFAQHANMRALFYASPEAEVAAFSSSIAHESREVRQGHGSGDGSDLDGDLLREGIRHIHYLHIGSPRLVRRVLKGAARLLSHSRIDFIQFPLDTLDLWTGQTINQYLAEAGYAIFEVGYEGKSAGVLKIYPLWDPERQHNTVQIIAIHQRVLPLIAPQEPSAKLTVNPFEVAARHGAHIRGLIHVGAYDGEREHNFYQQLGLRHAVLIEANPTIFQKLEQNYRDMPQLTVVNCAILDKDGPIDFHLTNYDEGNSILKPAGVLDHYSFIQEGSVISVPGLTLNSLLEERKLLPQWFNCMVIDIQGAETLALKGASRLLPHIDMITTEVNFENLYEGCGQIDEIDDILAAYGFRRVYTFSLHRAWGDALYLKANLISRNTLPTPDVMTLISVLSPPADASVERPQISL